MKTKTFSFFNPPPFKAPNLIEIQLNSFEWFKEKGLRELFEEISPIKDHSGSELELHFLDYKFDPPKYTEGQAKEKDLTYEAALRANLKLIDRTSKRSRVQQVYLGEFPIMTDRGTFIINGVERVVISQLIRSPGVYFTASVFRGQKLFGSKIIPNRGSWIELETDSNGVIYVKIDRKRKAPVTQLLRIFGLESNEAILEEFKDVDGGKTRYIAKTIEEDATKTVDESFVELYKRLRPGDLATADNARTLIEPMFQRFDRYDLGAVGRFKFNQRLDLSLKKKEGTLGKEDIIAMVKEVIRLNSNPQAEPDDADELATKESGRSANWFSRVCGWDSPGCGAAFRTGCPRSSESRFSRLSL